MISVPSARARSAASLFFLLLTAAGGRLAAQQPFGLTLTPIDNPTPTVVATNSDHSISVSTGGGDTGGVADSFAFFSEALTGDFDVQAVVASVLGGDIAGDQHAKAGLQARASLLPGSPNAQINEVSDGGNARYWIETRFRPTLGSPTDEPAGNPFFTSSAGQPLWLRLVRHKNLLQSLFSVDGSAWTAIGDFSLDGLPETLYVGLAVAANSPSTNRGRATFSAYQHTPFPPIPTIGGAPAITNLPGFFPAKAVSAVNWQAEIPNDGLSRSPDGSIIGPILWNSGSFLSSSFDCLASIVGEDPVGWCAAAYGTGEIHFGLAPGDPAAAQLNLGAYTNPARNRQTTNVSKASNDAWAPSPRYGVVMATTRDNGPIQWNDGAAPFYPHASVAMGSSAIPYFQMDDLDDWGGFEGGGRLYAREAKIGDTGPHPNPLANQNGGFQAAACDVSLAWFPYAQGWVAGSFGNAQAGGAASWVEPGAHSAEAVANTVAINPDSANALLQWADLGYGFFGGLARFTLPGVDPNSDGLLFLAANEDQSLRGPQANCAPSADGEGWDIAIREIDENRDSPSFYADADKCRFSFLFLPITTSNLIGGVIGPAGTIVQSAGSFTVRRLSRGSYFLQIPSVNPTNGVLLLQPVGLFSEEPRLVDTTTMSYAPGSNGLWIQCIFVPPGAPNGTPETFQRKDTAFNFAWVDFDRPMSPPSPPPALTISVSASTLIVTWPTSAAEYTLESTGDLSQGIWQPVAGAVPGAYTGNLSAAATFFRLRR